MKYFVKYFALIILNYQYMSDIKKLRDLLEWTQEQLASYLGTTTRTIQNWESGTKIPKSKLPSLEKLAIKFPNEEFSLFSFSDEIKHENLPAIKHRPLDSGTLVPLVNIDSVGGVWAENTLESSEQFVERMIPLPNSQQGDVAIMQSGDSMNPHIPAGAVLHIRKVEDWQEYFGYGNVYVLWLRDNRRITKLVKRYEQNPQKYVLCCSYNPDAADEELPRRFIREVWKVVNVLINKGW